MAKHTPGPWHWTNGTKPVDFTSYKAPGYYANLELRGPNDEFIAGCDEYDVWGFDENRNSNATLIAVAPDLYEFVAGVSNITDIGKSHDEDVRLLTALKDIAGRLLAKAESPNA